MVHHPYYRTRCVGLSFAQRSRVVIDNDTIAAVATPPGRGGIGIVRISGALVTEIAPRIVGTLPTARQSHYAKFRTAQGEVFDIGIALYFPAPHSFTGEDVLELQGHGGPVVMDQLLQRTVELGARLARPGEFSQRAFLNGKIDLAEAEAIADLIDSSSSYAAQLAVRSLQGEFSQRVQALVQQLIRLRAYVESAIDFTDEEIDFLSEGQVAAQLQNVIGQLQATLDSARQGSLVREGMTVVIAGQPNAGKSTLMNALAGHELAIVTSTPGTTRDVLRTEIELDGLPLHIIDTAGLRVSDDPVEQEGMRRAWQQIELADRILLLIDDRVGYTETDRALVEQLPAAAQLTLVFNKVDLTGRAATLCYENNVAQLGLSAKTNLGMDTLRQHLKTSVGFRAATEGVFMARHRHVDALQRALEALLSGVAQLQQHTAGELLAEDLRLAQQHLGNITGEFSSDDLLGEIFASFCIGK
ncbi:MAG: tRNA uridine-5-carboxymethylaminomethyl(34) synthesis GTPase MnmE [Gammaproteobacteria bacterium]|nr:tRNA uridine-5-carboxymethylaminomethyl(34) synthesis GTPase MnmE [Gammaproteobacteria bacterium]